MFTALLALHIVFAVFAVGPLGHAVTTAGRGIRTGDGAATAYGARMARVYSYASVLVVLLGFAVMSSKRSGKTVADFGDTWIWLSLLLWLVAIAITLGMIVPILQRATDMIAREESVVALTARVASVGGLVGLIFAGIVFLMVYRPGS
jgi:uncharacterized membrane protein